MKVCKYKEMSPMTHHGVTYQNEFCNKKNCPCFEECSEVEVVEAHYRATNIQWDTDGEDIDLPTEMDIPADIEDEDEISDYISDETGFCHFGFVLEIVQE